MSVLAPYFIKVSSPSGGGKPERSTLIIMSRGIIPVRGRKRFSGRTFSKDNSIIPVRGRKPYVCLRHIFEVSIIPVRGRKRLALQFGILEVNMIPVRGQKIPHLFRCGIFLFSLNFACAVVCRKVSRTAGNLQIFSRTSFAFRQDVL